VKSLRAAANVTGVGIGQKITAGKKTGKLAIRIYVNAKLPKSILGRRLFLSHVDGIPTDVVVSSPFRALGAGFEQARLSRRPVSPGISIGFVHTSRVIAGTLGALVSRGGETFQLSNNHILAFENKLPLGSSIVQPGMLDGGTFPAGKVGELADFVRLTPSGNKVDAALARVLTSFSAQPFTQVRIGTAQPGSAIEGEQVHKVGRTTGYTVGVIEDVAADFPVRFANKVYRFDDQILIAGVGEPFALDGDSGALVVNTSNDTAIGLIFAGSNEFSAANHIAEVLSALGVELIV
jgi:hypothetical protein